MINAIEKNLYKGIELLKNISDNQYNNCTVPPYYSSIGKNMRHILDIFNCIFEGLEKGEVDLSKRKRNRLAEEQTTFGIAYFTTTIDKIRTLQNNDFNQIIKVTDNLGTGNLTINYTLGGLLAQAHSHAIHHFASIGFIINQLGIKLPDADFGYNATTIKNGTYSAHSKQTVK